VRAFDAGERHAEEVQDAQTLASGIRVPRAIGDFMILDAVRESGGAACRAGEEELIHWMERGCALEGISLCPEAGACLSSIAELLRAGKLSADATTVVFNTGAVQKYIELLPPPPPEIKDPAAIDWKQLRAQASRKHSFSSPR
jgi:threonine synthase